jgi:hypothetical protein
MRLSLGITPKSYFNLAVPNDTDAQAFITAASITDGTQQSAVNQLVLDLKSANIWTKMKAIYPMVGGTATSCKFNLKDARDLDAAFRLVFSGGGTFSANGIQFNGSNSYINTFFNTRNNFQSNNAFICIYNRTNAAISNQVLFGNSENITTYLPLTQLYPNLSGNLVADMQDLNYRVTVSNSDIRGMYILNRSASNNFKVYKNNSIFGINTGTQPQTNFPNSTLIFGGMNNAGTITNYSNCQIPFIAMGSSLTDAEALAFYNAVQTFNTTLGRQV